MKQGSQIEEKIDYSRIHGYQLFTGLRGYTDSAYGLLELRSDSGICQDLAEVFKI